MSNRGNNAYRENVSHILYKLQLNSHRTQYVLDILKLIKYLTFKVYTLKFFILKE